jgi:hypothetical protein
MPLNTQISRSSYAYVKMFSGNLAYMWLDHPLRFCTLQALAGWAASFCGCLPTARNDLV